MDGTPDNGEPARKRARTSSLPTADLSALVHDAKLWFSDGNIILACGNTGFCVHAGVLSLNCRVFKDMLASGTPSAGEVYEGIDVVRLTDDAEDMRLFLTPMYYQSAGLMRPNFKYRVAQLKTLLDMARKYMATGIQRDTIEHLRELFPLLLERARTSCTKLRPSEATFDPWVAVDISLEHDVPIILPAALYYTALSRTLPQVLELNISRDATRLILLFREAFSNLVFDLATNDSEIHFNVDSGCPHSVDCPGEMDHGMRDESIERHRNFIHDIFRVTDADHNDEFYEDICTSCTQECSERQRRFAQRLWITLPLCCDGMGWGSWMDVVQAHGKAMQTLESEPES
ncbi:hypothetical protein PENSPDRAFT_760206 [Peniophora sp. CONT]|nr:hypothetical protein PENSPDRAFT_760206 [Peniophora sp. CONT]